MATASETILEVRGVTKDFPGLRALDDVSVTLRSGEILALLGKNGSGKSSLVKVLAGLYAPDAGTVDAGGAPVRERLHVIHQDLGLVSTLSTVENLALGEPGGVLRPLRRRAEDARAIALLARFGVIDVDVRAPVGRLTPAQRAIVAIARALEGWTDPRSVLVLDEPTALLHAEEVRVLFRAVREVARAGAGVVFVSHRLAEVLELADRTVVLRDGRVVADLPVPGLTSADLAELILGRPTAAAVGPPDRIPAARDAIALAVRGLSGPALHPFDLDVRAGEIVGVAGNLGSGREHVAGLIYGSAPRTGGSVAVGGTVLGRPSPHASLRRGMALVPADRRRNGGVMEHDVIENMVLPALRPLCRGGVHVSRRDEWAQSHEWAERVDLRPLLLRRQLGLFSGGNQQKVVLARWLRTRPAVLLVEEPTQGVDVGAGEAVRALLVDAAARGAAVLVTSSDHADLLRICHRVLVLRDGEVTAELRGAQLTDRRLTEESLGVGTLKPIPLKPIPLKPIPLKPIPEPRRG